MIHLTEEQIENLKMIKNIIDERIKDADLKFKSNHKGYTFWCPKDMNEEKTKQGYTFYAYGGRVLDLYYYFSKRRMEPIRQKLSIQYLIKIMKSMTPELRALEIY